jgi:hypothetical protein
MPPPAAQDFQRQAGQHRFIWPFDETGDRSLMSSGLGSSDHEHGIVSIGLVGDRRKERDRALGVLSGQRSIASPAYENWEG